MNVAAAGATIANAPALAAGESVAPFPAERRAYVFVSKSMPKRVGLVAVTAFFTCSTAMAEGNKSLGIDLLIVGAVMFATGARQSTTSQRNPVRTAGLTYVGCPADGSKRNL